MLNPIAENLLHDLRYNRHTRNHFAMNRWESSSCKTVGCLAGTAIAIHHLSQGKCIAPIFLPDGREDYSSYGRKILGISQRATANDLFLPHEALIKVVRYGRHRFKYLPTQARPALETVESMKKWAKSQGVRKNIIDLWDMSIFLSTEFMANITPDRAAYALERVLKDEIPYVNWQEAFEKA